MVPELEAVDRLEAVILVMRGTNVDETEPYLGHSSQGRRAVSREYMGYQVSFSLFQCSP
jgi:hypothetical protein